ncbi:MAG: GTP-binding protein [Erysipelotrichaceae bacterium]|nr:GTP-binding protein [Erysipelotrichaceae bacterium]
MTKVDIFSGFLGAGKTTLIRKLIAESYAGEKIVLIENEFGEIAIDGGFLQDAGIEIREMSQGCICCSLVGDFREALGKVLAEMHPERIIIEPSGVGKLSDVIRAVQKVGSDELQLNSFTTVVDVNKCRMYMNNFGEFFNDQIQHANSIILSRTQNTDEKKTEEVVELLRAANPNATIVTTPWDQLTGQDILDTLEHRNTLEAELQKLAQKTTEEEHHHHHHHHHDEDQEEHEHHHRHHDEDEDEDDEHEHHHHDEDEEEEEHEHHHHHHEHDEEEHEHERHHHHHHHHDGDEDDDHDADEIFDSFGYETSRRFDRQEIEDILKQLDDHDRYGFILRAKGIVAGKDGSWIHFDYVPEEISVRTGNAISRGRFCVIGSEMNFEALEELFRG